jgi:hypothetical protein
MKVERIVLGFAVIVVGVVWFLVNLGFMPAVQAQELWRYWPLLLVLWGLLMLFGKGSSVSGCLVSLLIIILIFGGIFAVFFPAVRDVPDRVTEQSFEMKPGIEEYRIDLTQHAGEFSLAGHTTGPLLQARLQTDSVPASKDVTIGNRREIAIEDEQRSWGLNKRPSLWEISLTATIPAEVTYRTGAVRAEFDLSLLQLERLNITAGAGDLTIRLGTTDTEISVDGGAGSVTIYVPDETGVRLQASGGLLTVDGGHANVESIGGRNYESRGLAEKEAVANIRITAGAGSVTLLRAR